MRVGEELSPATEGASADAIWSAQGDGVNIPTQRGSHSIINDNIPAYQRAATSAHEIFGHGNMGGSSREISDENAEQMESVTRVILGMEPRDFKDH